jgi:single-strand DNA-binding protein
MNENLAFLIGHLGKDPIERFTPNGTNLSEFTLATNDVWYVDTADEDTGEVSRVKRERTDWHYVVCWKHLGKIVSSWGRKGRLVYVKGRIRNDKFTDSDGIVRYTSKIIAEEVTFLDSKPSGVEEEPTE